MSRFVLRHHSSPRALLLAVVLGSLLAAPARAQNVIDDFATDTLASDYVLKAGSLGNWSVVSGELVPSFAEGYTALTTTDYSLRAVGDWVSIQIKLNNTVPGANGGLSVWKTAGNHTDPTLDRIFEPRLVFEGGAFNFFKLESEATTSYLNGTPTLATLKIQLTGLEGSTANLTASLSGSVFSPVAHNYEFEWDGGPLFVGPSAWLSSGANLSFDNYLTNTSMSPVPEPSTYAALFGAVALGLACWRRRAAVSKR